MDDFWKELAMDVTYHYMCPLAMGSVGRAAIGALLAPDGRRLAAAMEEVKVSVSVGSVTTIVPALACACFCRRFKRTVAEKVKKELAEEEGQDHKD